MNKISNPNEFSLESDPEKFKQVNELVSVIQSEKKTKNGWRLLAAFQKILGADSEVSEAEKIAEHIRKNPLPPES